MSTQTHGIPARPDRGPVDAGRISDLLSAAGVRDVTVRHVVSTGSTNSDLAAEAARGSAADRTVLLAEVQETGHGRMGRPWSAPAGSQLICSVLLAPESVDPERLGELPLFIGVACAEAVRELGVPAVLKWPNDLQVIRSGRPLKLAGILVEAAGFTPPAIVPGIGLNLSVTREEFDRAGLAAATSLTLEGVGIPDVAERERVTAVLLRHLFAVDGAWRENGDAAAQVRARYRELSSTLGTPVRAELPGGGEVTGTAVDLGPHGELVIGTTDGGRRTVTAGDVVHLRPGEE
ncbi:Bifunctional ligase/repressor BirA [Corynebacterium provencense]|uniref:biotin--[biotin carboxyl-carrier protein] ligase n=1 Tax=Corynebacterium provencense TaxID=1737425 RepID=A0A2Z3YLZ3_9CORY|nr:biotin--[acetyl-CoA-carboxylase] ligase [Corynebacterium provencense]AWT25565.1 Bifunctional ligase/repressor BirA [Corynebacterium provencense]